ncbi:ATP-grasp domain-containing protein [Massilia violaceinigra]|uniref:ATP-grasp domain-containing protein n=1 Tax=Massilia violaceinigra TaxID=2045208 RepID=A0ABY3ZZR3_9BURK|nr:ATP-grasp domain-containing protein [Massilia violaceinigra]UOD27970.1 ATP-grasp domain-containing protein [Massilia violaceinigra]
MDIARLDNKLIVISEPVGVAAYDFDIGLHVACTHPYRIEGEERCVLRIGPIADYAAEFDDKLAMGLRLVNSPQEHVRASELEAWYPLLGALTPRTEVFDSLPSADAIEAAFAWPVFMKGSRQTSKHNPALSVIRSRAHYEVAAQLYRDDPILHWQKPVIREFVALEAVPGQVAGKVRPSVEYRSFWWHGHCVGWGRYWNQVAPYACADEHAGRAVAAQAAALVAVPFLVVDVARTADGRWIVIECNDAQESGYAGIAPQLLWRALLARIDA